MSKIWFMMMVAFLAVLLKFVKWWYPYVVVMLGMILWGTTGLSDCYWKTMEGEIYVDSWGFGLMMMTFWVVVLSFISSQGIENASVNKILIMLILVLLFILLFNFCEANVLGFYFFFEASLIPMLMIILGFGYQPERLQAGLYFIFYTLGASLPLLFLIGYIYSQCGCLMMAPWFSMYQDSFTFFTSLLLMGAFLVKIPLFMVHLWLPSAHVEAPVVGSMILAGVLLKLGGYGIGRLGALSGSLATNSSYLISLSLIGMVVVGLICCQMNDLKSLIAYSSVAHMGLVVGGLFSGYKWGLTGALMMMIGHGLSSSGLFFMVNLYYGRTMSRSLYMNSGLLAICPMGGLMMFLLSVVNISAPPSLNFVSEVFLMGVLLNYDLIMLVAFPLGSFLGAVFTMMMFSFSQHGKPSRMVYGGFWFVSRESLILLLHILPLVSVFLKLDIFL